MLSAMLLMSVFKRFCSRSDSLRATFRAGIVPVVNFLDFHEDAADSYEHEQGDNHIKLIQQRDIYSPLQENILHERADSGCEYKQFDTE